MGGRFKIIWATAPSRLRINEFKVPASFLKKEDSGEWSEKLSSPIPAPPAHESLIY